MCMAIGPLNVNSASSQSGTVGLERGGGFGGSAAFDVNATDPFVHS
jgi:hypothetical protein